MSAKVKNHQMQSAPFISGVGTALPDNYVSQEELTGALRQLWMQRFGDVSTFDRLQGALGIQGRYLALPMQDYYVLDSKRALQPVEAGYIAKALHPQLAQSAGEFL